MGPIKTGFGNLARGKSTQQSFTAFAGHASRAVDGKKTTACGSNSCTHTVKERNTWWKVDLGDDYKVGMIKITNRGDCCSGMLKDFDIRVGNVDENPKANEL